jgi:hypothetical protein
MIHRTLTAGTAALGLALGSLAPFSDSAAQVDRPAATTDAPTETTAARSPDLGWVGLLGLVGLAGLLRGRDRGHEYAGGRRSAATR